MTSVPTPQPPLRVALAGAGRVGTAVAALLQRRGHEVVAVWSRTRASARRAAELLGAPERDLNGATADADVVLLGVPEAALAELGALLRPGVIACHFAGGHGVAPLQTVVDAGGGVCALHPVQACPDVHAALRRLPGSAWGVTCSPGFERWGADLVRELGGRPVVVAEGDRVLWHAAAATTANAITVALATGEEVLGALGYAQPLDVLGPLATGAITNAVEAESAAATLTGPIARGEAVVVRAHLDALRARAPHLVDRYTAAARLVLIGSSDAAENERGRADIGALLGGE